MVTIKILVIEIALVVITNFYHVLAKRNHCEDLLHYTEIYAASDYKVGYKNFKNSYKHLSIDKLKDTIDRIPGISDDQPMQILLEKLVIAYFWYLFDGILLNYNEDDILIDFPHDWCPKKVAELRMATIESSESEELQAQECTTYILQGLFQGEDILQEKMAILKALYGNWNYDKLNTLKDDDTDIDDNNDKLPEPEPLIYTYALGYFTHVDKYIDHKMHSNNAKLFGNIKMFCQGKGPKTIEDHYQSFNNK